MDHSRSYAVDAVGRLGLGSLMKTLGESERDSMEMRKQFRDYLRRTAGIVPDILQLRPSDVSLPTIPVCPVTGDRIANPWQTKDLESQSALSRDFPEIAEYFKACVGGPAYAHIAKLNRKISESKRAQQIPYGKREHADNPHCGGKPGPELVRQLQSDKQLAALYEREGRPGRLPWSPPTNMSLMAQIISRDPELGAIAQRCVMVEEAWASEMQAAAAKMAEDAQWLKRQAEGRLRTTTSAAERMAKTS